MLVIHGSNYIGLYGMSTEGSKFGKVPHGSISGNLTTDLARAEFKHTGALKC